MPTSLKILGLIFSIYSCSDLGGKDKPFKIQIVHEEKIQGMFLNLLKKLKGMTTCILHLMFFSGQNSSCSKRSKVQLYVIGPEDGQSSLARAAQQYCEIASHWRGKGTDEQEIDVGEMLHGESVKVC